MLETRPDASALLSSVFGFDGFRPGQAEIVGAVAAGKNVLAIMPTGGGKSLCFQLPAIMRDGVTVVISPLIALMRDQVRGSERSGGRGRCADLREHARGNRCRLASVGGGAAEAPLHRARAAGVIRHGAHAQTRRGQPDRRG
jgi:superfamily II DNA helicase RecQ